MLDLANLPTSAVVRLTKATPKREGSGIVWDVDFSMEVPDEVAAQAVDAYLPGAASTYAAREGSRGTASTSGGFDMMRVNMARTDGESLANCHAEVRKCAIKVTSSQGVLTVSLRLHGMVQDAAMDVVYQLDEQVEVVLKPHSTQLSLLPGKAQDAAPAPARVEWTKDIVGKLIVHDFGDGVIAGIVNNVLTPTTIEVATLEDEDLVTVDIAGNPDSILSVCAPKEKLMHFMLQEYIERCDAAKKPASWSYIVQAIGQVYTLNSDCKTEDGWLVDSRVLDLAFEISPESGAA